MAKDDFMEFDETKFDPGHITEQNLTKEIHDDFIDYAMSVIVARALPDVRDGLKPVQRRILYAMNEMNNTPDKPYKKCARIVGETMGKYHPHGDSSIYGALVYMAQTWNMREVLVDGHGNFGSMDGDGAAAMRYTEARMSKLSVEMIVIWKRKRSTCHQTMIMRILNRMFFLPVSRICLLTDQWVLR